MKNKKLKISILLIVLILLTSFVFVSCTSKKVNELNSKVLPYLDNIYDKENFKDFSFKVNYEDKSKTYFSINKSKNKPESLSNLIDKEIDKTLPSAQNTDSFVTLISNIKNIKYFNVLKIEQRQSNEIKVNYMYFENDKIKKIHGIIENTEKNKNEINAFNDSIKNNNHNKLIELINNSTLLTHSNFDENTKDELVYQYKETIFDLFRTFINQTKDLKAACLNSTEKTEGLKDITSQHKHDYNIVSLRYYNKTTSLVTYYINKDSKSVICESKNKNSKNEITKRLIEIKYLG